MGVSAAALPSGRAGAGARARLRAREAAPHLLGLLLGDFGHGATAAAAAAGLELAPPASCFSPLSVGKKKKKKEERRKKKKEEEEKEEEKNNTNLHSKYTINIFDRHNTINMYN